MLDIIALATLVAIFVVALALCVVQLRNARRAEREEDPLKFWPDWRWPR
jgi:hypothetical protein